MPRGPWLLDLGLSPKVVSTRMGCPRPSCSHRIHACQRSAKTAIVRYSEPAMGGTAAAILSGSPSAGTDARGLVRRSLREEHITRSRNASQTYANTTAPQAEPSRIRWRRVAKVQARPPVQTPSPAAGLARGPTPAPSRSEGQQTMRSENGCQYHNEFVLTILPNLSTNVEMSRKLSR